MDRRELLLKITATLTASTLSRTTLGQAASAAAQPQPLMPISKPTGKFPLDVYSRDLQWLRGPAEVAKAVKDIGLQSVDLTVTDYPGHVDPARVKTDLPPFVKELKQNGVTVTAITCPITDVDSPNAEAIIGTASSLGIHYYSWGGFKYEESKPYRAQLDALKPRIAKLAKLNEKHGMKALYQPRIGADQVGAAFFDLLDLLVGFDPRYVAFRYDTGSLLQATPQTMVTQLRLGNAYIGGVALNDAMVKLELPVWQDGPYAGTPQQLVGSSSGGDNVGTDGGNPLAIGGGGRPLPFHYKEVPAGMGMVDLSLVGKTLKDINFNGPAECQSEWVLGGAELGKDKTNLPRQSVLGEIKHNRLVVEAAFASSWNLDVARPAFLDPNAPKKPSRPGGPPSGLGGPSPL